MSRQMLKVHIFWGFLLLGISAVTVLSGCGSKAKKDFSLTIITSEKIGDKKTAKLPQQVIELAMPIVDCDKFTLVPHATLYRLGYERSTAMTLESKVEGGFAGNRNNPRLMRREIEKQLSTKEIGEVFAQSADPFRDLTSDLESYLSTIGQHSLGIFYMSSGTADEIYEGIKSVTSINGVRSLIAEQVCEKGDASVFVFLNPPIVPPVSRRDPQETDQTLKRLASINREAGKLSNKHQRYEALENVKSQIERSSDPSDYRYTYELVKNRIYGEEHHEAFDLLREAADIAIEQGQGAYLLDRVNGEKDTDLWKLSHGHPKDWHPIIEALEHNDNSKLHKHATAKK